MRKQRGFTLIEILIVIAITGILAAAYVWNAGALRIRGYRLQAQNHGSLVLAAANAWARDNPGSSLSAALSTSGLAAADYTDAPAGMPNPDPAYDCQPAGSLGPYAWTEGDSHGGCAIYSDTSAGFEVPGVLTWVKGDDVYYLNGVQQ